MKSARGFTIGFRKLDTRPFSLYRRSSSYHTSSALLSSEPSNKKQKKVQSTSKPTTEDIVMMVTPRAVDYSAWYGSDGAYYVLSITSNVVRCCRYSSVIAASDMIDQSPVRGCMVIKPWGMGVWDNIRAELDARIRDSGAQNAYFPLFIPMSFLSKEAEHVEGFAKECAVVTHHRLCKNEKGDGLMPDPAAELEVDIATRARLLNSNLSVLGATCGAAHFGDTYLAHVRQVDPLPQRSAAQD